MLTLKFYSVTSYVYAFHATFNSFLSIFPSEYLTVDANCRNQPHFSRLADWEGIVKVVFFKTDHFMII